MTLFKKFQRLFFTSTTYALLNLLFFLAVVSVPLRTTALADETKGNNDLYSTAVNEYIKGDFSKSRDLLNQILENNSDHSFARNLLREIQEKMNAGESNPKNYDFNSKKSQPSKKSNKMNQSQSIQSSSSQSIEKRMVQNQSGDVMKSSPSSNSNPVNTDDRKKPRKTPKLQDPPKKVVRYLRDGVAESNTIPHKIYGLVAQQYDDRVRLRINASGRINYVSSKITDPPMIILDIPNSLDQLPRSSLSIDQGNVTRIRHSQYKVEPANTTRIVVDLEEWTKRYRTYRGERGNELIIDVFNENVDRIPPRRTMTIPSSQSNYSTGKKQSESERELKIIQGDSQAIPLNQSSPEPLSLQLSDRSGSPVIDQKVQFEVYQGSGNVDANPDQPGFQSRIKTDKQGRVSAKFFSDTQAGLVKVRASISGSNVSRVFRLQVNPGEPANLVKLSGDQQKTLFGRKIGNPLVAELRDSYGNPIPGEMIRIQDQSGKGLVDADRDQPGAQRTITTNKYGRIRLNYYRIPSDIRKNKLQMALVSPGGKKIQTKYTIIGEPQLISIDFKDANLQDVLRTLAELANWNIAIPEKGTKDELSEMKITVHLREVTALRALDTILDIKNLSRIADGNVMKIVSKSKAFRKGVDVLSVQELDEYEGNNMVTVTYQLTYLKATDDLANQIQKALLADNASIVVDASSNSLVITDLANNQRRMKDIIDKVDRPDRLFKVKSFELQNTSVEEVADGIGDLLPTGQGNVVAHKQTNTLLVFGDPSTINRITKIVKKLDESGTLVDYWRIVDVEGYDPEQIAKRVNSVLAIQLFDVDQLASLEIDLSEGQSLADALEGTRKVDVGKILNSAAIIALPNMEKIIVFGPPDIRKTAQKMINQLKRKPGKYISERSWEWISVNKMPISQVSEFIDRFGGLKIQITLKGRSAVLVSSQNQESIRQLKDFISNMEGDMDFDPNKEIMVYQPVKADNPAQLATRIENYLNNLTDDQEFTTIADRVIYTDQDIMVLAVEEWERDFLRKMFDKIDQPLGVTKTYKLQNASVSSSSGGGAGPGGVFGLFFGGGQQQGGDDFVSILKELLKDRGIQHSLITYGPTNTILYTVKEENVDTVRSLIDKLDRSFSEGKKIFNYNIKFTDAQQLRSIIQNKNLGQLLYSDERRITLLIEDDQVESVREFLKNIDKPSGNTQVVGLDHRNAQDLANTLQTIFGQTTTSGIEQGGGGSSEETSQVQQGSGGQGNPDYSRVNIGYDNATNSVFFSGPEDLNKDVRATIEQLDTWQKQVLIEARLVEIRLDDEENWSPEWIAQGPRNQLTGAGQLSGVGQGDGGGFFNLGNQGQVSALLDATEFKAVLDWVKKSENTKVLTRPSITALNNSQAQLDLTEERFFQIIERDDEGNPIATTFESQEANKLLNITPTITSGRNVILDVVVSNDVFGQRQGPSAPFRVNTRKTENSVMISEGQTLVLGGIIQQNKTESEEGIPIIKDLPIVGQFAQQNSERKVRTELVVFMTPHIMGGKKEVSTVSRTGTDDLNEVETPRHLQNTKPKVSNSESTKTAQDGSHKQSKASRNQSIEFQGNKLNINVVSRNDFNGIFKRSRYKNIVGVRQENGFFTDWNDLMKRADLSGEEVSLLQKRFSIKNPDFNVNSVNREQLEKIPGISEILAKNMVDYRKTFGGFRSMKELRSIPGIDKEKLSSISRYLNLQDQQSSVSGEGKSKKSRESFSNQKEDFGVTNEDNQKDTKRNVNRLEMEELKTDYSRDYVKRIIAERRQNGYYAGWRTLKDRLDLDQAQLNELQQKFVLDQPEFDLNKVTINQLMNLPKVNQRNAQNIVDYRKSFGKFKRVEALTSVPGITDEKIRKIRPFLRVDAKSTEKRSGFDREESRPKTNFSRNQNSPEEASSNQKSGDNEQSIKDQKQSKQDIRNETESMEKKDQSKGTKKRHEQVMNLNQVTKDDFAGIFDRSGFRRIVENRRENGPFFGWEDFENRMNLSSEQRSMLQRKYEIRSPVFDLNSVSVEQIENIPGISSNIAQNIVDYRYTFGNYESLDELISVPAIDQSILDKLKSYLEIQ